MAVKLTDKLVDKLAPPAKGNAVTYDTEVKGFGIRITAAGARSFVLNYYTATGRERRLTIGSRPAWSTVAGRAEAEALLRRIDQGDDPLEARIELRTAPTVADLCDRYIAEHLPKKRPSSQSEDRSLIEIVLNDLRHRKVNEVDADAVSKLHAKVTRERGPYRANRVRSLLCAMFNLAISKWKMRDRALGNPTEGVDRNPEQPRDRYLKPAEITRLMTALAEYPNRSAASMILLGLLTGARKGELLAATWDQFDLIEAVWTKPSAHTKQKKLHRVPLSPEAWQVLKVMREDAPDDAVRLYPKPGLRYQWEQIRKIARIKDVHFHDIRHSFGALLASQGESLPIIGRLLGHTQAQTTMRYAHLLDDPLRKATTRVGKQIGGKAA